MEILEIMNFIKEGKYELAREEALKTYMQTKDDRVYNLYGMALMKIGELEKAKEVFREIWERDKKNQQVAMNLVKTLLDTKDYEKAIEVLSECIKEFPQNILFKELLDIAESRLKKLKEKEIKREEIKGEEIKRGKDRETEPKGKILEISLKNNSIILRESFIIFLSGNLNIDIVRQRFGGKELDEILGGEKNKFLSISGEGDIIISPNISHLDLSGNAFFVEDFVAGFSSELKYENGILRKDKKRYIKVIRFQGDGKVILSVEKKIYIKSLSGKALVSTENFIGAIGDIIPKFQDENIYVSGEGKIILGI